MCNPRQCKVKIQVQKKLNENTDAAKKLMKANWSDPQKSSDYHTSPMPLIVCCKSICESIKHTGSMEARQQRTGHLTTSITTDRSGQINAYFFKQNDVSDNVSTAEVHALYNQNQPKRYHLRKIKRFKRVIRAPGPANRNMGTFQGLLCTELPPDLVENFGKKRCNWKA